MKEPEEKKKITLPVAIQEKNIADNVLNRVAEFEKVGGLNLPENYSAANALKSAWLMLQSVEDKNHRPALEVCTKESIANALLDMVIQGLSPAKKQVYFIVRGSKLCSDISYFGTVAVTKRLADVIDVFANVIYDGDEFSYVIDPKTGMYQITKHEQEFQNINPDKILGAYAIIHFREKPPYVEIMNITQIKKSWLQGATKGNSGAHTNFTDQMAKRTVINRACKIFRNSSDDSDVLIQAINNSDIEEATYEEEKEVKKTIAENANKESIDLALPEKSTDPSPDEEERILAKELEESEVERNF